MTKDKEEPHARGWAADAAAGALRVEAAATTSHMRGGQAHRRTRRPKTNGRLPGRRSQDQDAEEHHLRLNLRACGYRVSDPYSTGPVPGPGTGPSTGRVRYSTVWPLTLDPKVDVTRENRDLVEDLALALLVSVGTPNVSALSG